MSDTAPPLAFTGNVSTNRWLFAGSMETDRRSLVRALVIIAGLTGALLVALWINHKIQHDFPTAWIGGVIAFAALMCRTQYRTAEKPAVLLLQLLGSLSALYALLHYPLMPVLSGDSSAAAAYTLVLGIWIVALICGVACFRIPSLALLPPAYLFWSAIFAEHVTGLPHEEMLDITPLPEVAICIGLGLAILRLFDRMERQRRAPAQTSIDPQAEFARIVIFFAIGIHLANYFWSSVAKFNLPGPWFAWITFNNPLYIYLVAIDNNHITFSNYNSASQFLGTLVDWAHIPSNIGIFVCQAAAIAGFFFTKRLLIVLLLVFDLMHLSIAVVAGANFWPWMLLNIAIAIVVAMPDYRQPKPVIGLVAMAFILAAPNLATVTRLGWYDSGANNKVYFQAEDASGQRYYVSPNFFTFYSYPIAHNSYGMPVQDTAFATGAPNGGAWDYELAKAGLSCDVAKLIQPKAQRGVPEAAFSRFVVNYHNLARAIEKRFGIFWFDLYPHHFYVMPSLTDAFRRLDKANIVAYIYRRESVCLSLVDGNLRRQQVSTGEFRIEVPR